MLLPFKKVIENPEDIPTVPKALMEFLQVQYNAGYFIQQGFTTKLKAAGYSEAYIAGYLNGLQYASNLLDNMEARRKDNEEG